MVAESLVGLGAELLRVDPVCLGHHPARDLGRGGVEDADDGLDALDLGIGLIGVLVLPGVDQRGETLDLGLEVGGEPGDPGGLGAELVRGAGGLGGLGGGGVGVGDAEGLQSAAEGHGKLLGWLSLAYSCKQE